MSASLRVKSFGSPAERICTPAAASPALALLGRCRRHSTAAAAVSAACRGDAGLKHGALVGWAPKIRKCSKQRIARTAAMRQRPPSSPPGLEWLMGLFTQQQPAPAQQRPAPPEQQPSGSMDRQPAPQPVQPPAVGHQPTQHSSPAPTTPPAPVRASGPLKASASQLLAGLPLEQMLQRNAAQRQLQRQQQQQLDDDGGWGGADEAATGSATAGTPSAELLGSPAPGTTAVSSSKSSLDGSAGSPQQAALSAVSSPEAAMALAAYEDAVAHRRSVPVVFKLRHRVEPGQRVKVVGGHASLGRWALGEAPEMQRGGGDLWQASVKLPAGSLTDYKYAVLDSGGNVLALQAGNSGVLAVRFADRKVEVQDSWAGDAGGVVAEGEAGLAWRASRETRLTAWAADLFQQLASLRQDLREARLEVVGAKEEASEARQEALAYQAQLAKKRVQLAEVETAHALDKARLVQAEALNALLKGQLAETTASLKEAIDTAAELLAEREEEWEETEEEEEEEEGDCD